MRLGLAKRHTYNATRIGTSILQVWTVRQVTHQTEIQIVQDYTNIRLHKLCKRSKVKVKNRKWST